MGYENNRKYVSTSTTRATSGNARYSVRLGRSEEHTSELQPQSNLVCRLLLEKKKKRQAHTTARQPPSITRFLVLSNEYFDTSPRLRYPRSTTSLAMLLDCAHWNIWSCSATSA